MAVSAVLVLAFWVATSSDRLAAEDSTDADSPSVAEATDVDEVTLLTDAETLSGHSYHGEHANEGPRQAADLFPGTGVVDFPVTTKDDAAQSFVSQGLGQFYGFWYLEAERSFRQAAMLDPDCAMAYWGAAMATKRSRDRAKGFIAEAVKLKDGLTEREKKYIDALDDYLNFDRKEKESDDKSEDDKAEKAEKAKKQTERVKKYTSALESIAIEFPDDIEAKALLALQLYENKRDLPNPSYLAVDGLLDKVFASQPNHSAHHFRIHLWDHKKPEVALQSAALCGPSSPAIAHMWHMPGHIYSRLKRYSDACWQQEASARVDHAHMMRDRVMPDQIHNFAHNNEWLIRNLNFVGRAGDAVDLAKNMIALPQHPKYNTLEKRGSAQYGRDRLIGTLTRYELWNDAIQLCENGVLLETDDVKEQIKRLRLLGVAKFSVADVDGGTKVLEELKARLAEKRELQKQAGEDAVKKLRAELDKAKSEDPKTTESKVQDSKSDEPKSDEAKSDEAKSDEAKSDEAKSDEAKSDEAKSDEAKSDDPKSDDPKSDEAKSDEAKSDDPKSDDPKSDDPKSDDPKSDDPKSDDPKSESPETKKRIDKARTAARKPLATPINTLVKAVAEVDAARLRLEGLHEEEIAQLKKASSNVDPLRLAYANARAGDFKEALKIVKREAKKRTNEILPLACLVEIQWSAGDREAAEESLADLQKISGDIDLSTPVARRLSEIASQLGIIPKAKRRRGDWRTAVDASDDLGTRPPLDSLGPFRWAPTPAADWTLIDSNGKPRTLADYRGRPVILIFYLGHGCLHCAEQLQAFAPLQTKFLSQGIEILAVSSDDAAGLEKSIELYGDSEMPISLVSDASHATFKDYRAYDDFEQQPLHGTFLIDDEGLVRWQDVGFEPFMDGEFLLSESVRLLDQ